MVCVAWFEAKEMNKKMVTSMKNPQILSRMMALLLIAMLAFGLAACGGDSAPTAAASAPAVAAGADAAQVAMADTPRLLSPAVYQEQFVAAGANYQLIDVRTPEEFASGYINGAVNIPVQELAQRLGEIQKDQPVVLYCRSGNRSAQAATILDQAGYTGVYDMGGVIAWQQAGLPLER